MSEYSPCAICGRPSVHAHHRKLRSQGGDNSEANLIRLCLSHHSYIHANPTESYEKGWLVKSFDDPALIPVLTEGNQSNQTDLSQEDHQGTERQAPRPVVESSKNLPMDAPRVDSIPSVSPGEKCPACSRRVPHEKKATSPTSKVVSYRCPLDDAETHSEVAEAAAEALGMLSTPHWRFAVNNYGYALILQGARLEEIGG